MVAPSHGAIAPDELLVHILDAACSRRHPYMYLTIRHVCRKWRYLSGLETEPAWETWRAMFYAAWLQCPLDSAPRMPKAQLIGNKNVEGRIALHGSTVHISTNRSHVTVASPTGSFYDVALRSIRRLTPHASDNVLWLQATYADAMCVGDVLYISTAGGYIMASNHDGIVSEVVRNEFRYTASEMFVSPLSNHDPDSTYGAALVYTAPRVDGRHQCILWILRGTLEPHSERVAATCSLGLSFGMHKSVAISVDGSWVCVEVDAGSFTRIAVYRVPRYNRNVFWTEIKHHRDIKVRHWVAGVCRDMVVFGENVVVVGPDGRLTAWSMMSGHQVWEWGAGLDNNDGGSFVTALAVHRNNMAILLACGSSQVISL